MIVRITYSNTHGRHDLEWIAPSDWTVKQVIECFGKRYPTASILAYLRIDSADRSGTESSPRQGCR